MTRSQRCVPFLVLALALAGCAVSTTTTSPYPPVPPPVAEQRPLPPVSPDPLIWQPGHWDWNGTAYTWSPGLWVPREGHGSLWQDGYWSLVNGRYVWVPPHWT
jgi:hypothetical protein